MRGADGRNLSFADIALQVAAAVDPAAAASSTDAGATAGEVTAPAADVPEVRFGI